jgi:nitrate reductase NapE
LTQLGGFGRSNSLLSRVPFETRKYAERGWQVEEGPFTKAQELRSFLFLAVVMAPVLTGIIVAGYGFVVWMYQLFAGPPVR